jgi:hypothetical protein
MFALRRPSQCFAASATKQQQHRTVVMSARDSLSERLQEADRRAAAEQLHRNTVTLGLVVGSITAIFSPVAYVVAMC